MKEIIKKLNCVAGNSLESEVKLTKEKVTGEFKKSSELENQQETLPKKSDKNKVNFRRKDNGVVRVKNGSSETIRSISDCS